MQKVSLLSYFGGGAVFLNAVSHRVSGTMGRRFPSPFAKPLGRGMSSATVNVVWGVANLAAACLLVGQFDIVNGVHALACAPGMLAIGVGATRHFGGLNGGDGPGLA